ncbi:hypothetical protein HU200_027482 [Digitaria exilis]|uniref:Uncharacterized protein n=1 Tax=Digitaria exilis TaxID=1010633 RepID=A0A835BTM3_9POAL|nr:hypothetical protein HU200_027482 [Digitaria exilis]
MAAFSGEEQCRYPRPVALVTDCLDGSTLHSMALSFAAAGFAVVATAPSRGSMRDLEGDPRFLLLELDLWSAESVRAALAEALRVYGDINVLVTRNGIRLVPPPLAERLLGTWTARDKSPGAARFVVCAGDLSERGHGMHNSSTVTNA